MRLFAVLLTMICASQAHAQVYKCVVNGKTQYAQQPCAPDAKRLNIGDSEADKQRLREAAQARAAASAAMAEAVAEVRRERRDNPAPARAPAARQPSKEDYCNQLLRTAKDAKDESNKWRYHQGLIDDAKRRQKEAEDEHFSKCYGSN